MELVGDGNALYLQNQLNRKMLELGSNTEDLKDLPASLYECIQTTKHTAGIRSLLDRSRSYQVKLVCETYRAYKDFLQRIKPDFVLFPLIEHYDAVVLYHLCIELGIKPVIYVQARNVPVSFFSGTLWEELPGYVLARPPSEDSVKRAESFVEEFRVSFAPPFQISREPDPSEILWVSGSRGWSMERFFRAVRRAVSRISGLIPIGGLVAEPHLADTYTAALKLKVLLFPITQRVRKFRGHLQAKFFDISTVQELPSKFVYYPLQLTPEASINVPTPYFVDQLRAVDLLLANLPANYLLVVKEHPAMAGIRPVEFYRQLRKRAGVLVAKPGIPSSEVMRRAALTVSVTGTACFESLLAGYPSLQLGRTFFSNWIYEFQDFYGLHRVLQNAINGGRVPAERAIDLVARLFDVGSDFYVFAPDDPYRRYEHVMNQTNVRKCLDALLSHIRQEYEGLTRSSDSDSADRCVSETVCRWR